MSFDADEIVERRRLRRKLAFWRMLGVVVVVLALVTTVFAWREDLVPESAAHVARVPIGGVIRNDRERVEMLERIRKSNAQAVILSINSPGGTVTGSEQLYDALRRLSEEKPVVAVVEGVAASGAYIAALGADHIVARRNGLVGSIGVIYQFPNVTELMKTVGVSMEEIKSSPLKAEPNPFSVPTPAARNAIDSLVKDSYGWFKGLVSERRRIEGAELDFVADGRVFTGHQGLGLKLVDEIGDERTARAWLAKNRNVSEDLKVRTWNPGGIDNQIGFMRAGIVGFMNAIGLPQLGHLLAGAAQGALERNQLDGLLALWHPHPDM
ncbi:signal peptide peptidase SppA [Xanthobacter sp. TB0136]|uniref:signal peptide peptidase SppA n=1 Tax=Xanthobacter sp. TB0136 TaxID=3459177 RepID=UPI00403910E5